MKQISGMPNRRLCRLLLFGVVAGTLVVTSTVHETYAHPAPNPQSSAIQNLYYFGVMGEVVRPGVYQYPSPTPRLIDLIHSAGGLSPEATGTIRVIRNARSALVTSCFASNSSTLMPGDLVIADGKLTGRTIDRRTRGRAKPNTTAPEPPIQLGFVNLVARRPIVVKVSGQRATLGHVLADLGQTSEILSTVRLIENQRLRRMQRNSVGPNHRLASETVLVFDPNAIDYDRVPAFPRPYSAAASDLNASPAEAAPSSQYPTDSANRRIPALNSGRMPTPATIQPPSMLSVAPAEPIGPPQTTQTQPPEQDTADSDDQLLGSPNIPTERHDMADHQHHDSLDSADTPVVGDGNISRHTPENRSSGISGGTLADRLSADAAGPRRNIEDIPDEESKPPSSERLLKFSSAILVVAVIVAVALFLAVSMLWSMARVPETKTDRQERTKRHVLLDSLIRDELPLIEEPVRLPPSLQLHGRPHAARRIRLDETHAVPKPVMDPRTLAAETQSLQPIASVSAAPFRRSSTPSATSVQTARHSSAVDSAWIRVEPSHTEPQPVAPARSSVPASIIDQALFSVQGDGQE